MVTDQANKKPIVLIGAGPANLMAAQKLAENGYAVHIYEQNKAAARKFLVAGNGGFNLTHSEDIIAFIAKYNAPQMEPIIRNFDNTHTIKWLHNLGITTYVGSSGKIFPTKEIKPIQVLQAWLAKLEKLGVKICYGYTFVDFGNNSALLSYEGKIIEVPYEKLILGVGGGSWGKTGSDAKWIPWFMTKGIKIAPLLPANSGFNTQENWSQLQGLYLKNIVVHYQQYSRAGEIVFTDYGVEGAPIYALNHLVRGQAFPLTIHIDLKPDWTQQAIETLLAQGTRVTSTLKEKLRLSSLALQLLKRTDKETFTTAALLASYLKKFPITITSFRPIDEVISTAGGVSFDELNMDLSLKKHPNIYCIGEMVDWEAPTGGYLLQACFSMGAWVAKQIVAANNKSSFFS